MYGESWNGGSHANPRARRRLATQIRVAANTRLIEAVGDEYDETSCNSNNVAVILKPNTV